MNATFSTPKIAGGESGNTAGAEGAIIHITDSNRGNIHQLKTSQIFIMEQKRTINFGAGPAKLPQSVSSDPSPRV